MTAVLPAEVVAFREAHQALYDAILAEEIRESPVQKGNMRLTVSRGPLVIEVWRDYSHGAERPWVIRLRKLNGRTVDVGERSMATRGSAVKAAREALESKWPRPDPWADVWGVPLGSSTVWSVRLHLDWTVQNYVAGSP